MAGQAFDVPVRVADAAGVIATSDNSTVVTLTFRDQVGVTRGVFSASTVRGEATIRVTGLTVAGTYRVTAGPAGLISNVRTMTIIPAANTQLVGEMLSSTLAAANDSSRPLRVYSADQYGNTAVYGTLSGVTISSSDTNKAVIGPVTCSDTHWDTAVTATTNVGTPVLTAQKAGLAKWQISLTTTVVGDAKTPQVLVDQGGTTGNDAVTYVRQRVRVRITDANGNLVTQTGKQQWIRLAVTGTAADGTPYSSVDTTLFATPGGVQTSNGTLYSWSTTSSGQTIFYVNSIKAGTPTYTALVWTTGNDSGMQEINTNPGIGSGTFQDP